MFSLSTISVFATIAFSALTSALPIDLPVVGDLSSVPVVGGAVGTVVGTVGGAAGGLPIAGLVGRDQLPGIAAILSDTQSKLGPAAAALKFVHSQNVTADAVTPHLNEVKTILTGTVTSLQALVGQPVEVILASVEGTALITVKELGVIVAGLVIIVFEALGAVLTVAGAAVDKVVFDLLVVVGGLVGTVLALVLSLVGTVAATLVAVVVPLLETVVPFILHLNIATVLSLLGIHA